ncbi:MAG: FtsX-like permease family protein [Planctomycetota bacterium]|nr:FtsX-like permease family protein [Planctomycetota bacterium]
MGLSGTLARRNLLARPGRTTFSILGITVGIATVVAVFTVDHVTLLSRTPTAGQPWSPDFEVRPSGRVDDPRQRLMETPGVAEVTAFFQHDVSVRSRPSAAEEQPASEVPEPGVAESEPVGGRGSGRRGSGGGQAKPVRAQMVALDAGAGEKVGAYYVADGTDLDPEPQIVGERQVLLGRALAENLGLAPGDDVLLSRPRRTARKACVEGEIRTLRGPRPDPVEHAFRVVGVLADEGVGRKARGMVLVVDYETGQDVFRGAFVQPRFWIKRDLAVDVEDLGVNLGRGFSYEVNKSVIIGQMEDERAFRNGVRMAGLLAMVLGLFVIFHTLSMSLIERVREVAVLHALGSSRGQIARIFFGEALAIAILAGLFGFGGGVGLAKGMLAAGITTLGVQEGPIDVFEVPWKLVVPLSALGVSIALIGSIYPLLRARGTDTVSALRGEDLGQTRAMARGFHIFTAVLLVGVLPALYFFVVPVVGAPEAALIGVVLAAVGVLAVMVALPLIVPSTVGFVSGRLVGVLERLWPLAGKLAARSVERSPSRIAASVAAIALVTAAFVGLKGMTNSLRAEVEIWGEEAIVDKVFVHGLPDVSIDELIAALDVLPEVVGVEPGDARTYVPFLLLGLRAEQLVAWGPCASDPALARAMADEQVILVSKRLARHRAIEVGDEIAINTSGHGVQSFRVAGITDEYGYFTHPDERMYGVVADRHIERYFCLDTETTSTAAVRLAPGSDPDVVQAAILAGVPAAAETDALRFELGREVLDHHIDDITRDFVLFDIILALTAVLAGVGVLNGQLLAALERAKELGVLRALGMTRRQAAGMVLLESAVIGITGAAIGLAVGAALTPVIVEALQVVSGLPLPHKTAGAFFGWSVLGALVIAAVAALYPIWRMNRLDAVRAVRTG